VMLRGKTPEETGASRRLKLLMFAAAKVGKTRAALQMPRPYVIDSEHGTDHYGRLIQESQGAVYHTSVLGDAIAEVATLVSSRHSYRTIVIDSFTVLWEEALETAAEKVGTGHGRHYGAANIQAKRLFRLLAGADMNVVVTAHEKKLFDEEDSKTTKDGGKVVGTTFDGYRGLDYVFDLILSLHRTRGAINRTAKVEGTRLEAFPDLSGFPWTIEELLRRCGREGLLRDQEALLADSAMTGRLHSLLALARVGAETLEQILRKAGAPSIDAMTAEKSRRAAEWCIERALKLGVNPADIPPLPAAPEAAQASIGDPAGLTYRGEELPASHWDPDEVEAPEADATTAKDPKNGPPLAPEEIWGRVEDHVVTRPENLTGPRLYICSCGVTGKIRSITRHLKAVTGTAPAIAFDDVPGI